MDKKIYLLGIAAHLILIALSVVFYKERTIFVDIAYHLFSIIQSGGFAIQNFRFGAICTQLLPVLAFKLHFSLQAMAVIYSISFSLFYFSCYLFIGLVLKNYGMALVLLLFNILFSAHTFYWIQSELPQAIAIMIVVWAMAGGKKIDEYRSIALPFIFVGLFTVAFTHPLAIFPFLYVAIFFYVDRRKIIERKTIISLSVFFGIMILLKTIVFKTEYESGSMGVAKRLLTTFPHYFNLYSNKQLLKACLSEYYWIPLFFLVITVTYFLRKQYTKLLFFLVFIIAYILLINVSYPDASTPAFYIENMYLPIGVFIAIPLIYDIMPVVKNKKLLVATMALIIISGCIRLYATHTQYTARLNWKRAFLAKKENSKLLISANKVPMDTLFMSWATPYEFWLLSTIENKKTASIIINDNPDELSWALHDKDKFLTTWGSFTYNSLPSPYFIFKDTVTTYTLIK